MSASTEDQSAPGKGAKGRRKAARLKNQPTSVEGTQNQKVDSEDGDAVSTPKAIGMLEFAKSRVSELQNMMKAVKTSTGTRRVSQALPRHMRRRAASHNIKRLPVRLRAAALREVEKHHGAGGNKAASRRHKRRPSNLTDEFARRQRNVCWLETHLWHAKRMHMAQMWGHRLATTPCDKGRRAAYRSTARGCMMADTSYYTCVELCGSQEGICQAMQSVTSPKCGPTVRAAQFLSGQREGTVFLFKQHAYPHDALGPAQFLWRSPPVLAAEPPAKRIKVAAGDVPAPRRHLWLWLHPALFDDAMTELRASCQVAGVSLSNLKHELCRFSLFGPKSQPLLKAVLECYCLDGHLPSDETSGGEWWREGDAWRDIAADNAVTWHSHSVFPSRTAVAIVVRDPRIGLPDKRRGLSSIVPPAIASSDGEAAPELLVQDVPPRLAECQLWDATIRQRVNETKVTEQQFNKRRAAMRLSPEDTSPEDLSSSLVPVLLCRHSQGFGWDVILPGGWAMAFWVPLIYHGVRTGGQEEIRQYRLEAGLPIFPHDSFDTISGKDCAQRQHLAREEAYLRHPPAKRVSFPQLAVCHPFHLAWEESVMTGVKSRPAGGSEAYILRSASILRQLQQLVCACSRSSSSRKGSVPFSEQLLKLQEAASLEVRSFVPVCLETADRGVFVHGATISMPTMADLRGCSSSSANPVQPRLCPKTSSVEVVCVSDQHKVVLCSSQQPCRATIGFVCNGVHSLSRGGSVAVGFCSLPALLAWLSAVNESQTRRPVVLLRNISSYQYRSATVKVLMDSYV